MAAKKQGIVFQKKALEHINTPVLIDDVLQVVSAKNWALLVVLFFIMCIFVIWLIAGKLFIHVDGSGILMSIESDVISIQSPEEQGTIEQINLSPGEKINLGSVLLTMNNPLKLQLETAQKYLDQLQKEQQELAERSKVVIANIEKNQTAQVSKINESRVAALEKLRQLGLMQALKEKALKKGIIDLPNVTETRIEYYRLLQDVRSHEAELISMQANMIDLRDKWIERQRDFSLNVLKAEYEVNLLTKRWEQSHTIKSPVSGILAELRVKKGDYSKPGDILLTIIPEKQTVYAMVFVPGVRGKLIKKGMSAQINPTIFNKLEYGSIKGRVTSISFLPVSQEYMMSLFKNTQLVQSFLARESLMAVKIKLDENANTPSGYQWTTRYGPDFKLTQGTLINATINIEIKHPIDFLVHFGTNKKHE